MGVESTASLFSERMQHRLDAVDRNRYVLACVVGYGLCRCISGIPLHLMPRSEAVPWSDAGKIAGILLMVGACVLPALARRLRGRLGWYLAPTVCSCMGALAVVACQLLGSEAPVDLARAALVAVGLGPAAVMLQWLELVGYLSLRSIVLVIAGAELLSASLSMTVGVSGPHAGWTVGLLAVCSGALLLYCRRGFELSPSVARMPRETLPQEPRPLQHFMSWKLMAWVLLYCCAYGVVTAHLGLSLSGLSNDIGAVLPCAATLALALVVPEHFDMRALKRIALSFMVAGLLLAALAPDSGMLMQACVGAGAASCRLFAYSLACMRARQARVSAIPACGAVKALIIAATSGGVYLGSWTLPLETSGALVVFVLAVCLASACIAPFNITEQSVIEEARQAGRTTSQAVQLEGLAQERGLSQRETTVFKLMARGMNASEISEELFITKSAVRAHQSRIYAKLGVHGQQEFAQVVERQAR